MNGRVRIIGGKWRSRQLFVPTMKDLRPTPDRVRETLFNWLSPWIAGARCLDPFAGTGVLGFEALSRGAAYVEMIDTARGAVENLQRSAALLGATEARIYQAKAPDQMRVPDQPFDIVFLDPPYQEMLLLPTCFYLEAHHYLADVAYIYVEAQHAVHDDDLPCGWQVVKSGRAGHVFYHLVCRNKLC
ncbi:MAG TPA: 16S rRNA (guanine(966)-N(2))-methyltransferase RsmD [Gammaproteobacteria bacterium]|jgi:16S rRNA (guanine966-N2)-methyltransferase|nr:16S rRNA (guanine(966)-N(2))-methyltransferase RsmD [Gammaproteobacteria bacterium]